MKKSAILLFIILIAMIISSCDAMHDAIAPSYEITFHSNPPDGSKNKTVTVKIKDGKELPDAEKDMKWSFDNYKFDGWKTQKGTVYEKALKSLNRGVLYAQWKATDN